VPPSASWHDSALARPDAGGCELERHVDQDQLRREVGGDGQVGLVLDLDRVTGPEPLSVDLDPTIDDV
jgi:hypothetical protein